MLVTVTLRIFESAKCVPKVLDYNMVYSQGLPNDKKVG